ncbi:MAG: PEGA domain-containing protein [bacterium]
MLGLDETASRAEIEQAGRHLLQILERRERRIAAGTRAAEALARERDTLVRSLEHWTSPLPAEAGARSSSEALVSRPGRASRALRTALILTLLAVSLGAWLAGYRIIGPDAGAAGAGASEPGAESGQARLIVDSRPKGAELRIRRSDDDELLLKIAADGARLEIDPGRYELEVAREDCPDSWRRSVALAPGRTRRFEPSICQGEGRLVVRSNVVDDRLRIDGFDYGSTRPEAHVLAVGDHTIRVDKRGHAPFEGEVRLAPGETLEVHAELVPLDAARARKGRPLPFEHTPPTPPPAASPKTAGDREAPRVSPLDLDLDLPPVGIPDRLLSLEDGRGNRPRGGSTTWHDAVSRQMVARFDQDGSGLIDRVEESEAIPCEIWREIERDFDEGGLGLSLSRNYGFDGSEWIDGALGFSREIRSAVHARMQECGLAP